MAEKEIAEMIEKIAIGYPTFNPSDFIKEFESIYSRKPTPTEINLFLKKHNELKQTDPVGNKKMLSSNLGVNSEPTLRPQDGYTLVATPDGMSCSFQKRGLTAFLENPIKEGIWRWTVRISYGPGVNADFRLGAGATASLNKWIEEDLGTFESSAFGFGKEKYNGQRRLLFWVYGVVVGNGCLPKELDEIGVPDGSDVSIEANVARGTLCFFVGENKVPYAISNFTYNPFNFGMTASYTTQSFVSKALVRLSAPTPSLVQCSFNNHCIVLSSKGESSSGGGGLHHFTQFTGSQCTIL